MFHGVQLSFVTIAPVCAGNLLPGNSNNLMLTGPPQSLRSVKRSIADHLGDMVRKELVGTFEIGFPKEDKQKPAACRC
jgi:hypothetical protein